MSNIITFPAFGAMRAPIANIHTGETGATIATVEPVLAPVIEPVSAPTIDSLPDDIFRSYGGKFNRELFQVHKETSHRADGRIIPNAHNIIVNDTSVNNGVTDAYEVHQADDSLQSFINLAHEFDLKITRVIINPVNGGLTIQAQYTECFLGGDEHLINLVFHSSHCGKFATLLTVTTVNLFCDNQLPAMYKDKSRHVLHAKHYIGRLDLRLMEKTVSAMPAVLEAHNQKLLSLRDKPLTMDGFANLMRDHYKLEKDSKAEQKKLDHMRAVFANATGQSRLPPTYYKALQAMTYENTHNVRKTKFQSENILVAKADDSLRFMSRLLAA